MAKVWYHGTPRSFETFAPEWIGKGNDQLGSGFYFTDEMDTARSYALKELDSESTDAGTIVAATLDIEFPLPRHADITAHQIATIMRASPDFNERLEDFGETAYEGVKVVLSRAVRGYLDRNSDEEDDTLDMLNCLSNDFFRGVEHRFLKAVTRATGFDGLYRVSGEEMHAVVWFPEQVRVVERIDVPRDQPRP